MYEFQFDDDDYDMYEIIYAENPIKILVDDQFDREWSHNGHMPYYQMNAILYLVETRCQKHI